MAHPNLNIVPPGRLQAPDAKGDPAGVPFVSVVIPVRNEEAHLGTVLDDLMSQDYPRDRFEILVVDGQSTDRSREVVKGYVAENRSQVSGVGSQNELPRVILLSNPGRLSSSGPSTRRWSLALP